MQNKKMIDNNKINQKLKNKFKLINSKKLILNINFKI